MFGVAVVFGVVVGFALGLTGGGGGVFAVPLLVYGLSVAPREAVGISLASVGGTALFGVTPRLAKGEVELRTGLLFAVAGMLGAPVGNYVADLLPENMLLVLFAVLMFVVAWRMWVKSYGPPPPLPNSEDADCARATCQRDEDGKLRLNSKCALLLVVVGLITGFLSGMLGVGGGFVIVPALVLFSGMNIHGAVATSLLVIVLVSVSGVSSYLLSGNELNWRLAAEFLVGGFVGMAIGTMIGKRLPGATLQKVFAAGIVLVAIFVLTKSVLSA